MNHKCHIPYCQTNCKPEWLMCYRHWQKVPYKLQKEVWKHYVAGQCDLNPPPTAQWHEAADAAIKYVVKIERRKGTRTTQTRLL